MLSGNGTWLSFIITALANFGCQYNFQSIAVALIIMSTSVCTNNDDSCRQGDQASWVEGTASAVVFIGAIIGQVSLGILGDVFTRNKALSITLLIASISAFLSAVAPDGDAESIYSTIISFRFLLGIGIGGIFPLSATKASEDSGTASGKVNSTSSCWAFFFQMPAIVAPWLLGYIFSYSLVLTTSQKWRIILGLGAVPLVLASIGLTIEDYLLSHETKAAVGVDDGLTTRYSYAKHHTTHLSYDVFLQQISDKKNIERFMGCGVTWFLFDIVVYGVNLLGGVIIDALSGDFDNISSDGHVRYVCSQEMIASSMGIPATILGIFLLPYLGLKWLQFTGFLLMTFMLILIAGFFAYLKEDNEDALFALYVLLCFALQYGLGICSFSLPAAMFPREVRSSFNGFAAATGKAGAMIGAFALLPIAKGTSFPTLFGLCSIITAAGALLTYFYIDVDDLNANSVYGNHEEEPEETLLESNISLSKNITSLNEEKMDNFTTNEEKMDNFTTNALHA